MKIWITQIDPWPVSEVWAELIKDKCYRGTQCMTLPGWERGWENTALLNVEGPPFLRPTHLTSDSADTSHLLPESPGTPGRTTHQLSLLPPLLLLVPLLQCGNALQTRFLLCDRPGAQNKTPKSMRLVPSSTRVTEEPRLDTQTCQLAASTSAASCGLGL